MACTRCGGFMVREAFEDLKEEASRFRFSGWRCVICGDVLDPVIAHHRAAGTHGRPLAEIAAPA